MLPRYIAALSMDFVVKHEILGKGVDFAKRQFSSLADLDGVRMVLYLLVFATNGNVCTKQKKMNLLHSIYAWPWL